MRIGIYNEPSGGAPGGSESAVAVFAHALRRDHDVAIVHHRAGLQIQDLEALAGVPLDGVNLRLVPREDGPFGATAVPWRRYRAARAWQSALSRPYDLFINSTHGLPPFCHARRGMLLVLFPFFRPAYTRFAPCGDTDGASAVWRSCRGSYASWEWRQRMDSYQLKAANSRFTRDWTRRLWGIDCQVLYPPVDTSSEPCVKNDAIVSVGRFSQVGHTKKQMEMVSAFRDLRPFLPPGWTYHCVGALDDSRESRAYFEAVRETAEGSAIEILANLTRSALRRELARARIFWHAAGYGEDEGDHPERSEHFGIATVEAMAAGCVPVVIDRGAQPEIVEHGVSGFLWRTVDELRVFTRHLAEDEVLWRRMSDAARARARAFSRDALVRRFRTLLEPMVTSG